jgi:hypothetical protein
MVQINHDVDPNDVSGGGDWPLLKDGDYPASIVGAEAKLSKAGDTYLQIQFDLGSGNLWQNFNLWHTTSEKAQQIARQELNEMGVALGLPRIGDTDELIAKRLILKVGTEPAQGEWPAKNKIVGYKPLNEGPPTSQPVPPSLQVTTQTEKAAPAGPPPVWNT